MWEHDVRTQQWLQECLPDWIGLVAAAAVMRLHRRTVSFIVAPHSYLRPLSTEPPDKLEMDCIDSFPTRSAPGSRYSHVPRCKEGASVRHIEQRIARKPRRQIGVRDKELAEGYCIRLTVFDDLIRLCQRVFFIRDV